jgi:2-pyrone-4,6-dicarboxylate lactonase
MHDMRDEKWISETVRSVETLSSPRFSMPERACDTHMHVFGAAEVYSAVSMPKYTMPSGATPDRYAAVADILGIERIVLVQPSYYGVDNSCMLDAMSNIGRRRCRGVVFLPERPAPSLIDELGRRGVCGVRIDLFKAELTGATRQDLTAMLKRTANLAKDVGWHMELYSPGRLIAQLAGTLSDLTVNFSINHMGYVTSEGSRKDHDLSLLFELAQSPYCWMKLSGPYRLAAGDDAWPDQIARHLVAEAPDRAIWGSDWPHIPDCGLDTAALLNRLAVWCPDEIIRNKILVTNPARLYQF